MSTGRSTDSNERDALIEGATRLFEDHSSYEVVEAAEGSWAPDLWRQLVEMGVTRLATPEPSGGDGGVLADAVALVRVAGRFAAPVPLAENLVAARLAGATGLTVGPGPMTFVSTSAARFVIDGAVTGFVSRVPWASVSTRLLVAADSSLVDVDAAAIRIDPATNLAGEPRDDVTIDHLELSDDRVRRAPDAVRSARFDAALLRAAMLAGAMEGALDLTVAYAAERIQFGRPIGRFQAVQQQLAEAAGETQASVAAVQAAATSDPPRDLAIAVAKARASRAAGVVARVAHQVHGAIGVTREHSLHHLTRRLWAWRDENGSEVAWHRTLGLAARDAGADDLWPLVTNLHG